MSAARKTRFSRLLNRSRMSLVTALVVMCLIAYTVLFAYGFIHAMRRNYADSLANFAVSQTNIINQLVRDGADTLSAAGDDIEVLKNPYGSDAQAIAHQVRRDSTFTNVLVIDPRGHAFTDSGSYINVSDRAYFKTAFAGDRVVAGPFISRATGDSVFIIAEPLVRNGHIIGVIAGEFGNDRINAVVNMMSDWNGYSHVIDAQGRFLYRSDRASTNNNETDFFTATQEAGNVSAPVIARARQRIAQGLSGTFTYRAAGSNKVVVYEPLDINNWTLVVIANSDKLSSSMRSLSVQALVFVCFMSVLIFIVLFLLNYYTKRNIETSRMREHQLAFNNRVFQVAFGSSRNFVFSYNPQTHVADFIAGSADHWGLPLHCLDYPECLFSSGNIDRDFIENIKAAFADVESGRKDVVRLEINSFGPAGEPQHDRVTFASVPDDLGHSPVIAGYVEDNTVRFIAEQQSRREQDFREAVLANAVVAYGIDFLHDTVVVLSGSHPDNTPVNYSGFISAFAHNIYREDRAAFLDAFDLANIERFSKTGTDNISVDFRMHGEDSRDWRWMKFTVHVLQSEDSAEGFGWLSDITVNKEQELSLIERAEHDELTGLYNRATTVLLIDGYLTSFEAETPSGIFYIIDIDDFKAINDTYGHPVGDIVLSEAGRKLQTLVRDNDIVGRIGGDEFVVFMKGSTNRNLAQEKANAITALLRTDTGGELPEGLRITASVGYAFAPDNGTEFSEVYRNADRAQYAAKRSGVGLSRNFETLDADALDPGAPQPPSAEDER